ncbi:Ig-like domain-containing protein, partial [Piscinibacter sp.]|uniref:Ig-like domain-containing protein n=1 Tax=Piscinibacter sp. TaxID=1903157 RepID=UPI002B676E3C
MKILKWLGVVASALALVACGGGGGDSGSSPFNPDDPADTPSAATSVEVLASSVQVGSGGDQVSITAIVKGAGNVSLPEAPVTFSTDSGTLTAASVATDEAGVATATLSSGADKSNRTITVTVTSGDISGSVEVAVVGTELKVAGSTTQALGSDSVLTVTARDSNGNVLAGVPISVSSSLDNGLSGTSVTTNAQGVATVTYTATNPGEDEVTFSGAGATATATITISGENFAFVSPGANSTIDVGDAQTVTVRYLLNGAPQAGMTVNFAATAGAVSQSSAVTNSSGQASTSVSSTTASPATVQATLLNADGDTIAQATLPVEFVATVPAELVLQIQPTAIPPNPDGSTANQAEVLATVTDANGNPVKNVTVNFNRSADPSGGNLSQASGVTDSSGQASVNYIAGALSTASNGVQISGTVAGNTSVTGTGSLTVNQSALFIALGTGNV